MLLSAVFKCGCDVVSQCQFMPPKWKSKLKDLCRRRWKTHRHRHTHAIFYLYIFVSLFFASKCDLYEKSQQQAARPGPAVCVWNILQRLSFLNSISQTQVAIVVAVVVAVASCRCMEGFVCRCDVETSRCINKRFRPLCRQEEHGAEQEQEQEQLLRRRARRPHRRCVFY